MDCRDRSLPALSAPGGRRPLAGVCRYGARAVPESAGGRDGPPDLSNRLAG